MSERRRAYRSGRRAETWAAFFLRIKGYRILVRGFRVPSGEIDIVARRGRTLAIVEVKRRQTLQAGLDALSPRQRRRIMRATEAYLAKHPRLRECHVRFDLIVARPRLRLRHVVDAWRP